MTTPASINCVTKNKSLAIHLNGSFTARYIATIDKQLESMALNNLQNVEIDFAGISNLDTAGAWVINKFCHRLQQLNVKLTQQNIDAHTKDLLNQVAKSTPQPDEYQHITYGKFLNWLDEVGRTTVRELRNAGDILAFLGEVMTVMLSSLIHWHKFRFISIVVFLQRVGFNALPIVGLISFLIGVILIYQGNYQMKKFGAEIYAIDLLAISMLREVGIMLTAIVIAGRSGSAFTAQIGTMKLNQEVDAMRIIGLNPIEVLVLPRMIALLIAMPLLVFYTDVMGLLGGAFMARLTMDISFDQFLNQLNLAIGNWTFWTGMIKAPVFAFIIALIGCYEGMQVKEGAESVGFHTTRSVVESIFLVIVFNGIFSVMFTFMGI